jgi:hypothetical protein
MERMRTTALRVAGRVAASGRMVAAAALLLAVAGVLAPGPVTAESTNPTRQSTEQVCHEDGGIYWESYDENGNLTDFGCDFLDGTGTLNCDEPVSALVGTDGCWWTDGPTISEESASDPAWQAPAAYESDDLYVADERYR